MHNIFIQRQLPADNYPGEFVQPWDTDWSARNTLLQQIDDALSAEPSVNGVLQGIRRIYLGRRGIRSSYFPSKKNAPAGLTSISLATETRPELTQALILERDISVRAFRLQAITVPLSGGRVAYPDFVVVYTDGRISVTEVKADKTHLSVEARDKLEQIKTLLHRWGLDYQVVDTKDQPSGTELENLHWLYREYWQSPSPEDCKKLLTQLHRCDVGRYTYGGLKTKCQLSGLSMAIIPHLLFIGTLQTHWQKRIDDRSEVWL